MNYRETLDFIYAALPMFHRTGPAAYKPNLDNTLALAAMAGNPEKELTSIHVAGTNGKGSVSHMLASVFMAAGYKTGLYTSPHLRDFRERMRVNGTMVPEIWISDWVSHYREKIEALTPSFFEMSTIMAFDWFRTEQTAVNIIETGLGGRLDSTNIISPELSVITNIGWDHMNLLGDTLERIAGEKAGIIKPAIPVVIGESLPETRPVFLRQSLEKASRIHFAENEFRVEALDHDLLGETLTVNVYRKGSLYLRELECDLTGSYQLRNICTVLAAFDRLREKYELTASHLRNGLAGVKANTGLQGRWQILQRRPLVICDTGHNEQGWQEIRRMLATLQMQELHFVLGVVEDKDLDKMLRLLPKQAVYYFCKADIPRGLDAAVLAEKAALYGLKGTVYASVNIALETAKGMAGPSDLIFIGGSTFTVAEVV